MLGPRSRASSRPSTGAAFSSRPGAGTPTCVVVESQRAGAERERRAFGRAEAGDPRDGAPRVSMASSCMPSAISGRSPAAAKNSSCSRLKKWRAEGGVLAQRRQQHLEAARHVEVGRRGDVAQVGDASSIWSGTGRPVVDVQRAAVVQHDAEVVVAAERVIPRQPVAQHRRRVGEERAARCAAAPGWRRASAAC